MGITTRGPEPKSGFRRLIGMNKPEMHILILGIVLAALSAGEEVS